MIQCQQCEFFRRDERGAISLACDPFSTIKEAECLTKWQLLKLSQMVDAYQATLGYYHKLAPMQDRLFKAMERELNDMDDSDKWKLETPEDEEENGSPPDEDKPPQRW